MNNIDKWCAEQCGITWSDGDTSYGIPQPYWYNTKTGIKTLGEWTIQDPRCREVVKERFLINTDIMRNPPNRLWQCISPPEGHQIESLFNIAGTGKTIAEAEIACITAIWEARDD